MELFQFFQSLTIFSKSSSLDVWQGCLNVWMFDPGKTLQAESNDIKKQSPRGVLWKDVLRNFRKFTGKHLCQSFFFNNVTGLRPATLLKKTLSQVFSCEFCEISKNCFSYKTPLVAASGLTKKANSSNLSIQDLLCLLSSC